MDERQDTDILIVTTTVAVRADAERLARGLLERRLAACVQLVEGLTSFYRWEGSVGQDAEVRVTIKTTVAKRAALLAYFDENHPYDLPQFVAWRAEASARYGGWVSGEVEP
jgi:periplasmic divalent cation tolerance protein